MTISKKYYSVFLIFLISNLCLAQEKLIQGLIIIYLDDASPEGIVITNSRTNFSPIPVITGSFRIHAPAGDLSIIRSYFSESRKFYLTKNFLKNEIVRIPPNLQ